MGDQTNLFSFLPLNIRYVVLLINGTSLSTKFGHLLQGEASFTPSRIYYSGRFLEKHNHVPLSKAVPFDIEIEVEDSSKWMEQIREIDSEVFNGKPKIIISPTMKCYGTYNLRAKSVGIRLFGKELLATEFSCKLQPTLTDEIGQENNIWFKGKLSNGKEFELNLYAPILKK